MKIIIATDIFGHGEYLEALGEQLKSACSTLVIVSPYIKKKRVPVEENEAYKMFLRECGHEQFSNRLAQEIAASLDNVFLLGFSAGASAIWRAIGSENGSENDKENDSENSTNLVGFVGFYPTQIRNHLKLSPPCPTKIIFPCAEAHFDIIEVSKALSSKPMVACQVTGFHHGFMNPLSKNYSSAVAKKFINTEIKPIIDKQNCYEPRVFE